MLRVSRVKSISDRMLVADSEPSRGRTTPQLDRLEAQSFDALKVAAVVREEREVVSEGGGGDQNVEVGYDIPGASHPRPLPAEDRRRLAVQRNQSEALQEIFDLPFACRT